jgi:hypothetical protein
MAPSVQHAVSRFITARQAQIRATAQAKAEGAAPKGAPDKDAKAALLQWMQAQSQQSVALGQGVWACVKLARKGGQAKVDDVVLRLKEMATQLRSSKAFAPDVTEAFVGVLTDVAVQEVAACKRTGKSRKKTMCEEERDAPPPLPEDAAEAQRLVASRLGDEQAQLLHSDAAGSTTRVHTDADTVATSLSCDTSVSAMLAVLHTRKRSKASLVGQQKDGELDLASVLAETVFRLSNPETASLAITRTKPGGKHANPPPPLPGTAPSAVVHAAQTVLETFLGKEAAKRAKKEAAATAEGFVVDAPGAAEEVAATTDAVSEALLQTGPKGSLDVDVEDEAGNIVPAKLTARESVKVQKAISWAELTRALRAAVGAQLATDPDGLDPDIGACQLVEEAGVANIYRIKPSTLIAIAKAVQEAADAHKAAFTTRTVTPYLEAGNGSVVLPAPAPAPAPPAAAAPPRVRRSGGVERKDDDTDSTTSKSRKRPGSAKQSKSHKSKKKRA